MYTYTMVILTVVRNMRFHKQGIHDSGALFDLHFISVFCAPVRESCSSVIFYLQRVPSMDIKVWHIGLEWMTNSLWATQILVS